MKHGSGENNTARVRRRGDRLVYTDRVGDVACITRHAGIARIPAEFRPDLLALSGDLCFALDCMAAFGGIPVPVAKAILRNLDSAQTAIDLGLKSGKAAR